MTNSSDFSFALRLTPNNQLILIGYKDVSEGG